jgi:hypothetical protein
MTGLLVALGLVVAVAAAIRSTWSPCGVSMLSTVTPLAERSRGHRFGFTAAWFVLGATVGGASLGLVAAGLAAVVHHLGLSSEVTLIVAAVAAALTAASDIGPFGLHLPTHGRQVDELWLGRYRRWVYASGFGWQIGAGVVTYIMTAAVYLLVVLAALTGRPGVALALVTLFGLLRGLAVLGSWRITTPAALHQFHRRFDALGPASRQLAIGVQLGVAVITGVAVGPAAGVCVLVVAAVLLAVDLRPAARRDHSPRTVATPRDSGVAG